MARARGQRANLGGYLKGPRAVSSATFTWPNGKEEGFTPMSKSEPWLVEAVAAKHVTSRCLRRTTIFQDLRADTEKKRAPTPVVEDPRLAALHYDEDTEEKIVATPVRKSRRKAETAEEKYSVASPEKSLKAAATAAPVVVRMRPTASAGAEKLEDVKVVLRGSALLLGMSSVPWLIKYLAQEMEDGWGHHRRGCLRGRGCRY